MIQLNKAIFLIVLLIAIALEAFSQTLEWKSVGTQYALHDYSFQDDHGSTWNFGETWFDSYRFRIVDHMGTEVYSDTTLLNGRRIVYGSTSNSDSIQLLSSSGELLYLDTFKNELSILRTVISDKDVRIAKRVGNKILALAYSIKNGEHIIDRIWLNATDWTIEQTNTYIASGQPLSIKYDSVHHQIIELYSLWNSSEVVSRNPQDSIIWKHIWSKDSVTIANVLPHSNGRTYSVGYIQPSEFSADISALVICMDSIGNVLWENTYLQDTTQRKDIRAFYDIMEINDGRIVACGTEGVVPFGPSTDALLAEIDSSGNMLWSLRQHIYGEGTSARQLFLNQDRSISIVGTAGESDHGNPERLFTAKFQWVPTQTHTTPYSSESMTIYPNPSQNYLHVKLTETLPYCIMNQEGGVINRGVTDGQIDISNLPSGSYFLTLGGNEFISSQFVKP